MSVSERRAIYVAPAVVDRVQSTALVVGVVALALCVAGAIFSPLGFWRAYLVGYVFWTGVAVGSLAIIMLHHLSGGGWGVVVRRILEAATRTLPLMALLFLPLIYVLVTQKMYPWTDPEIVRRTPEIEHKARLFLNLPFFLVRTVFYFVVWGALAYFLNKWSLEQDATGDPRIKGKLQNLSGPGIVLFGLTVTFAAIDWIMSLEPTWYSTIFGLMLMAGWGLSAFAFMIVVASLLSARPPMDAVLVPRHFHDYGKLLLAFIMLWAYFSFSQFLITWSGNLPEEIPWYLRRLRGGWQFVALAIVVFHFALPFVLLLSRDLKRRARTLSLVAILVLVMRVVDLFWVIAPSAADKNTGLLPYGSALAYALNFITPIGIGGLWVAFFAWQLKRRPLLPLGDKELESALDPAGGGH